jgi:hypothetical protein
MGIVPDFVGLLGLAELLESNIKTHLLVFNKLAVAALDKTIDSFSRVGPGSLSSRAADLRWLRDQGVVIDAGEIPDTLLSQNIEAAALDEQRAELASALSSEVVPDAIGKFLVVGYRLLAVKLREVDGFDAVPVVNATESVLLAYADPFGARCDTERRIRSSKEHVLHVVMRAVPEPTEDTSLEQILEFRADEAARRAFSRLRVWMSQIAKGNLNPLEAAEQLESALFDYEAYMHLHKMKTTRGKIESIVMTTAEVGESLALLKFSTAAKMMFDIRSREVELMEAEMKAPGREVAYLSMIRKRFGGTSE